MRVENNFELDKMKFDVVKCMETGGTMDRGLS